MRQWVGTREFCLQLLEETMERSDEGAPPDLNRLGLPSVGGSPRDRPTVHQRLDSDIDECFTALDDLKSKLMPYLMEMPETADIPLRDAPRTPLEATVMRVEVIREQIRDLVNRVVP